MYVTLTFGVKTCAICACQMRTKLYGRSFLMANECNAQKELYSKMDAIIAKWRNEPGGLIPIMQGAQEIFGCVSEEVQTYIAESLNIPFRNLWRFHILFAFHTPSQRKICYWSLPWNCLLCTRSTGSYRRASEGAENRSRSNN